MKRTLRRIAARCLVIAAGVSLAACMPGLPTLPAAAPAAATASPVPVSTSTPLPTETPVLAVTETFTAIPTLTATEAVPLTLDVTASPSPSATDSVPALDTPGITGTPDTPPPTVGTQPAVAIFSDKLPADTTYKPVKIRNVSHAQMDISLHCTTQQGLHAILEYNNVRNLLIDAPEGDYVYVVYVGGRQIVGSFSLRHVPGAAITVYADHVSVR